MSEDVFIKEYTGHWTTRQNIYKYVQIFPLGEDNMATKNITLKVNSELYSKYRQYCKKRGLIISRQFEIAMEKQLTTDNEDD